MSSHKFADSKNCTTDSACVDGGLVVAAFVDDVNCHSCASW